MTLSAILRLCAFVAMNCFKKQLHLQLECILLQSLLRFKMLNPDSAIEKKQYFNALKS